MPKNNSVILKTSIELKEPQRRPEHSDVSILSKPSQKTRYSCNKQEETCSLIDFDIPELK